MPKPTYRTMVNLLVHLLAAYGLFTILKRVMPEEFWSLSMVLAAILAVVAFQHSPDAPTKLNLSRHD